mmetsp:Transcript_31423/g.83662  ORF Transcript_31423/g.83662 Transcript_31423/m.83662 type:complete len:402 (-) Transcript_31423:1890-3095(-)
MVRSGSLRPQNSSRPPSFQRWCRLRHQILTMAPSRKRRHHLPCLARTRLARSLTPRLFRMTRRPRQQMPESTGSLATWPRRAQPSSSQKRRGRDGKLSSSADRERTRSSGSARRKSGGHGMLATRRGARRRRKLKRTRSVQKTSRNVMRKSGDSDDTRSARRSEPRSVGVVRMRSKTRCANEMATSRSGTIGEIVRGAGSRPVRKRRTATRRRAKKSTWSERKRNWMSANDWSRSWRTRLRPNCSARHDPRRARWIRTMLTRALRRRPQRWRRRRKRPLLLSRRRKRTGLRRSWLWLLLTVEQPQTARLPKRQPSSRYRDRRGWRRASSFGVVCIAVDQCTGCCGMAHNLASSVSPTVEGTRRRLGGVSAVTSRRLWKTVRNRGRPLPSFPLQRRGAMAGA